MNKILTGIMIIISILAIVLTGCKTCKDVPYVIDYDCSEMQPVVKQVPIDFEVTKNWIGDSCIFATCVNAYATIKNNDDVGRDFSVKFNIAKSTGGSLEETPNSVYIAPHSTGTISAGPYKFHISSFSYQVTPPTKEKLVNELLNKTCQKIEYKNECN